MDENYFKIHNLSLTKKLSFGVTVLLLGALFLTISRSFERQNADTNAQIPQTSIPTEILSPTPTIEISLEPTSIDTITTDAPEESAPTYPPDEPDEPDAL